MTSRIPARRRRLAGLVLGVAAVAALSLVDLPAAPGAGAESRAVAYLPALLRGAMFASTAVTPPRPAPGWRYLVDPNLGYDVAVDPVTGAVWSAAQSGGAVRWDPRTGVGTSVGVADGVASWSILSVAVDRDGAVWLGGADGWLSRRDAAGSWQVYGPEVGLAVDGAEHAWASPNAIADLFAAPDGTLWVLQAARLLTRAPDGRWQTVPLGDGKVEDAVSIAVGGDGRVWVGAVGYLWERDPAGAWTAHGLGQIFGVLPAVGMDVATAADGSVAVATLARLIVRRPGQPWSVYGQGETGGMALAVAFDTRNRLWLGTETEVRRLRPDGGWDAASSPRAVGLGFHYALAPAVDGAMAAGSRRGVGLIGADDRVAAWSLPGPLDSDVARVAFTPRGDAWLAYADRGISMLSDGDIWAHEDDATGLGTRRVQDLAIDPRDGSVWVAAGRDGLRQRRPAGGWRVFTRADGLAADTVVAVHVDAAGNVWAGYHAPLAVVSEPLPGVSRRAPDGTWKVIAAANGIGGDDVDTIASDAAGNVWFAHYDRGVTRLDAAGRWSRFGAASGLITDSVRALAVAPDGTAYVGTPLGLRVMAPGGGWSDLPGLAALVDRGVSALFVEPDGRVWIGTSRGVVVRAPDGRVTRYDHAHGELLGDGVAGIAVDPAGNAWIASSMAGVSIVDAAARRDRR